MTFSPAHIEISGGVVRDATITSHSGTRTVFNEIGAYQFFVELVAADGGRIGFWSGPDYEDAIHQAEACRVDFGIDQPVRDTIAGTH